jgi:hypothetical protein
MMDTLSDRLRELADVIDRGDLPDGALDPLERAVNRAERDRYIIAEAVAFAGGVRALLAMLERNEWRLQVWRQRGSAPEVIHPAMRALFEAGPLPCDRHLRRILGHEMSGARRDDGRVQPE